jgi:hypothetical protein
MLLQWVEAEQGQVARHNLKQVMAPYLKYTYQLVEQVPDYNLQVVGVLAVGRAAVDRVLADLVLVDRVTSHRFRLCRDIMEVQVHFLVLKHHTLVEVVEVQVV